jgi:hypothetical protein
MRHRRHAQTAAQSIAAIDKNSRCIDNVSNRDAALPVFSFFA